MKILLAITSLFFVNTTSDYLADYAKIVEAYTCKQNLTYTVSYKSFDTNRSKPDTVLNGKFEFKGKCFRSSLAGTESIKNEKYYLSVDHSNKIMYLTYSKNIAQNFLPTANIDTVLRKMKLNVTVGDLSATGGKRYTIVYPPNSSQYKSISMEFDVKSYLIKKVTMKLYPRENEYDDKNWNYLDDPFIEMVYSQYNTSTIEDGRFSLDKFLVIGKGDDAVLTPAFKGYELVNSISISKKMN